MLTKSGKLLFLLLSAILYLFGCSNAAVVQQSPPSDNTNQLTINDTVMPDDIVKALDAKGSGEEESVYKDILITVELPRSLSIAIPNIDMSKVHDTHPLRETQIDDLKSHGFSNEKIATMDYGDCKNVEKTWPLTQNLINNAKKIYPELANMDISK